MDLKRWGVVILVLFLFSFANMDLVRAEGSTQLENYEDFKTFLKGNEEVVPEKVIPKSFDGEMGKLDEKLHPSLKSHIQRAELIENEPNNSFDLADRIELEDIIYGQFYWHDVDVYQIDIEQTDWLYVVGLSDYNVNLGYALADEYGNVVDLIDYYEDEDGQVRGYPVTPGTYYIVALDLDGGGSSGAYALSPILASSLENDVYRIYGDNRYETASEIAYTGWPSGSKTVVLARDNNFPDALAGAPLAYDLNAPILLNPKDYVHDSVKSVIRDLGVSDVVILGGTGAISSNVEKYLQNTMKLNVKRIGGDNRFETAAKIAEELEPYDSAVVSYGFNFPDALSIAPYAAVHHMPILLTNRDSLPDASKGALKTVDDTIIVGGPSVVSENVKKQLKSYHPIRISGANRYETSVNVVRDLGMQAEYMTIATGQNYADALTGSVLAAKWNEPIVLVQKNEVPAPVSSLIEDAGAHIFTILGGPSAVSPYVEDELRYTFH